MFNFDFVFRRLSQEFPAKPEPFVDAFQCLIFCIISLRTKDETTYPASARLFNRAPNAAAMADLPVEEIAHLIFPAGFYKRKAEQIFSICQQMRQQKALQPPHTLEGLLALPGVGLKTANLTLSRGFGLPAICVDVHVHRICNRMGFIVTKTPNESEAVLRQIMPKKWWISSNDLLVRFGQQICTPISPRCSLCFFTRECPKAGIIKMR